MAKPTQKHFATINFCINHLERLRKRLNTPGEVRVCQEHIKNLYHIRRLIICCMHDNNFQFGDPISDTVIPPTNNQ